MSRIVLTTLGSWGDLFPFVGLAVELERCGHEVCVAASPAWEPIVAEAGVAFAGVGRRIGFEEFAQHPEIFGRVPLGLRAALGRFVFDQIDELSADLAAVVEGAELVVTHPAHLAAQNVAESAGVPVVVATVFPGMIPSAHTVPGGSLIGPWEGPLGRAPNRLAWRQASVVTAALFDRPINRHRRSLGLRPVRSGLFRLPMRARRTVVMAPAAVVGHPPDWPAEVVVCSFVGWDRAGSKPVTAATEAFLAEGPPPVLVTLGASNAVVGEGFFDRAAATIVDAEQRALVVTGPGAAPAERFDPSVVHISDHEPFSAIAPRCRAAIHHAGIGTTVAVMRAGIPHLAVPMGFDQPITAALIERLGIGVSVPWRKHRTRLRTRLDQLLDDPDLSTAASTLARELGPDGAPAAAAAVAQCIP